MAVCQVHFGGPGRPDGRLRDLLAERVAQVPAGGIGRVKLANEEWRATARQPLNVGDAVKILAVQGNTLEVGIA